MFQSTPAITGGRCAVHRINAADLGVSIHARHYWRAMPFATASYSMGVEVSIHARHYWRAMPFRRVRWRPATAVSIHARHYWRAMHAQALRCTAHRSFNPRPPLLAGDAALAVAALAAIAVSIHARHYWRAMPERSAEPASASIVSIHARHYWRAMPHYRENADAAVRVSIHARHYWRAMLGAVVLGFFGLDGFNPRPPLLAGDARVSVWFFCEDVVSIHARHYWRAMHCQRMPPQWGG